MRKSKFMGLKSGTWTCTYVGVEAVVPAYKMGTKIRNKYPGHMRYYYVFERPTSDGKALKMIRLSAAQARLVLGGKKTVEEYSKLKESERSQLYKRKVSYSFCD